MAEFTLGFVLATLSCLVLAAAYKMADNHKKKCAQSKWESRRHEIKTRRRYKNR